MFLTVLNVLTLAAATIIIIWRNLMSLEPLPDGGLESDLSGVEHSNKDILCMKKLLVARLKVHGKEHKSTLDALYSLGILLHRKGQLDIAEVMIRRALKGKQNLLGIGHIETLRITNSLAVLLHEHKEDGDKRAEVFSLLRSALEGQIRSLGWTHIETLGTVRNLALFLESCDDNTLNTEAEAIYGLLLSLLKLHGNSTTLDQLRIMILLSEKRIVSTLRSNPSGLKTVKLLYKDILDSHIAVMGETDADTLCMMHKYGLILIHLKEAESAEKIFRKTLSGRSLLLVSIATCSKNCPMHFIYRNMLIYDYYFQGKDHPQTLDSANNLGVLFYNLQQHNNAEKIFRRVLVGRKMYSRETHREVLDAQNNLGVVLIDRAETRGEGYNLLAKVCKALERDSAPMYATVEALDSMHNLAVALLSTASDVNKAKGERFLYFFLEVNCNNLVKPYVAEMFTSVWKGRTQVLGAGHEDTISSLEYLAMIAQQENDLIRAKNIFEQLLLIRIENHGESHLETIDNMVVLAKIQSQLGRRNEAIDLYNKILNEQIRTLGIKDGDTLDTFRILVQLLQEDGRVDEVTHLYDTVIGENVNIGREGTGVNSASFIQIMDNYTVVLSEQGRREEAKNILRLVLQVHYDTVDWNFFV